MFLNVKMNYSQTSLGRGLARVLSIAEAYCMYACACTFHNHNRNRIASVRRLIHALTPIHIYVYILYIYMCIHL